MSHITEIKTVYQDLEAIREAAEALGGVFMRDQLTHETYGKFVGDSEEGRQFVETRGRDQIGKCLHAIRLAGHQAGDYEVGVVRALDGHGYKLVVDTWGPGRKLEAAFGKDGVRLEQEYKAIVATKKARQQLGRDGFSVHREVLDGGTVRLRVRQR